MSNDRKLALRLLSIAEDVMGHRFEGLGKPEPLKFELSGCWSRRLSAEHHIVYKVYDDQVECLMARQQYGS